MRIKSEIRLEQHSKAITEIDGSSFVQIKQVRGKDRLKATAMLPLPFRAPEFPGFAHYQARGRSLPIRGSYGKPKGCHTPLK